MKLSKYLITGFILLLIFSAIPAYAQSKFGWSDSWNTTDCTLAGGDVTSANICYGTLLEYRLANGNKPLGFGGIAGGVTSEKKLSINFMGITAFNDMLWTGVNVKPEGLQFSNFSKNITFIMGVSLIKFNGNMWK